MWLLICAVIGTVGCNGTVRSPSPSYSLPRGVPSDTAAYRERVAQYPASGPTHQRKRKGKCLLSLCSVEVNINARGNTLAIDPNTGPADPIPVAHLVNLDKHKRDNFFLMKPADSAEYDLWVGQKASTDSKTVWWLVETSHTSDSVTTIWGPKDLNYCHNPRGPNDPTTPDADFAEFQNHGKCDYDISRAAAKVSTASLFSNQLLDLFVARVAAILTQFARSDGGWIDCNNGCCT
jgi:hypothetical protein